MALLKKTVTIEVPEISAEDWQLFSFEGQTPEMVERCNLAARRLNETFAQSVNSGWDRGTVEAFVMDKMVQFSDTGASDSEPHHKLQDLLDEVFGPE